jgi:hypothetical protein
MENKHIRKVLIVAPLSTLERVWLSEIFAVLMHRRAGIVHGSREYRLNMLKVDMDFYIINPTGLAIDSVRKAITARGDIDLVIVDEASTYCNASTRQYSALAKLLQPEQRLWLLTGTPCSNAPTDAWALARLVSPRAGAQVFRRVPTADHATAYPVQVVAQARLDARRVRSLATCCSVSQGRLQGLATRHGVGTGLSVDHGADQGTERHAQRDADRAAHQTDHRC